VQAGSGFRPDATHSLAGRAETYLALLSLCSPGRRGAPPRPETSSSRHASAAVFQVLGSLHDRDWAASRKGKRET